MKAIFLDIDGVIATPTSVRLNWLLGRGPTNQFYDSIALTYLGRLVQETGAVVVLTSTWREDLDHPNPFTQAVMANLYAQLKAAGAPVFGPTPVLHTGDRSDEVAAWLDKHPCEAYVIFDDLATFESRRDVTDGHLVIVEDSEGIRYQHFYRALELLTVRS